MKSVSAICVIMVIILTLTGCIFDRIYTYEEIKEYVLDNLDDLEKMISDNEGFQKSEYFDYKEYLGLGTIVDIAYSYSSEIIEFSCGGAGNVTDSKYCGFYYSKNDTFYGLAFDGDRKTEETDGSMRYYYYFDKISYLTTKRICPHWFYYYMEWH